MAAPDAAKTAVETVFIGKDRAYSSDSFQARDRAPPAKREIELRPAPERDRPRPWGPGIRREPADAEASSFPSSSFLKSGSPSRAYRSYEGREARRRPDRTRSILH
jgi:hypothetical protein